jgi:hypothetical protein
VAFGSVEASEAEKSAGRPGDALVDPADVVMDRAFTVQATPEAVWPWLVQLGKGRAGWYLPRAIERFLPGSRRAARYLNPAWLGLKEGDVIPDYGGRNETFLVAQISPPRALVYRSRRGRTSLTWSLALEPPGGAPGRTRVFLRLRMAPVRHTLLARTAGELIDLLTVAGMAAGLAERLRDSDREPPARSLPSVVCPWGRRRDFFCHPAHFRQPGQGWPGKRARLKSGRIPRADDRAYREGHVRRGTA